MPGSEYKVIGTLMNKETGEALLKDGKPVTAQAEFKAEKAGGSVEVTSVSYTHLRAHETRHDLVCRLLLEKKKKKKKNRTS